MGSRRPLSLEVPKQRLQADPGGVAEGVLALSGNQQGLGGPGGGGHAGKASALQFEHCPATWWLNP